MNWIKRMYELKGCDLYSQNCEGLYLEYIWSQCSINPDERANPLIVDIGGGDGFYLSNTRHIWLNLPMNPKRYVFDKEVGITVTRENIVSIIKGHTLGNYIDILSIDTDGNDYWILQEVINFAHPKIIVAEFNPAFTDSRAIKYNPAHDWDGSDYYGFSFEAGKKLAEKHGYKVIFQTGNMNMFMVRADLIEGLEVPAVTYTQNKFFRESNRTDWVMI